MSSLTLSQQRARLNQYLAAETAILKSQSYTIKDRTLTRADLKWVQKMIKDLEKQISLLTKGGIRTRRAVPRDL